MVASFKMTLIDLERAQGRRGQSWSNGSPLDNCFTIKQLGELRKMGGKILSWHTPCGANPSSIPERLRELYSKDQSDWIYISFNNPPPLPLNGGTSILQYLENCLPSTCAQVVYLEPGVGWIQYLPDGRHVAHSQVHHVYIVAASYQSTNQ